MLREDVREILQTGEQRGWWRATGSNGRGRDPSDWRPKQASSAATGSWTGGAEGGGRGGRGWWRAERAEDRGAGEQRGRRTGVPESVEGEGRG